MTETLNSFPPAAALIVGAILLPFLPRRLQPGAFLVFPSLGFFLLWHLETGSRVVVPFLGYDLVVSEVDRLSLTFGYVFSLIGLLGGIYGFSLMDRGERVSALLYAGSSLGVVFAGDLLTLFFFWEIMAVSSVVLVWARRDERSNRAGMRYLLVHITGGSILMAGILWHYKETGSLLFRALEGGPAAYLILLGFLLNAAVPPLHAWLVDSYPEATVSGGVFLSAFTTKVAVYVLIRGFAGWELLVWAGVFMAVYGVIFAVLENDIRRLLAYHIISQVGYMVAGAGLGTETAVNGATAHAFAHILYKGLLFMGAGAVLYSTGRSKLTELGGLARHMPLTLFFYMVGAWSISGVPLFSGFVSKSVVIHAAEISHEALAALLLHAASVGTFLSVALKLPYYTWLGRNLSLEPVRVQTGMHVAMLLASIVNVAIGVHPDLLYKVLPFPVAYRPYTAPHLMETIQLLFFTWLGFWLLKGRLTAEAAITLDVDWFYRRPAPAFYRSVVLLDRLFASIELLALSAARSLSRISADPVGYVFDRAKAFGRGGRKRAGASAAVGYDPNRYRPSLGVMVLVMLACLAALLLVNLVR